MSDTPDNPFDNSSTETTGDGQLEESPGNPGIASRGPGNLLNGQAPGPSVSELMNDYGVSRPWAILMRGGVRSAIGDGIPPLVEIIIGSLLGFMSLRDGEDGGMLESEPGESNNDTEEMFE